MALIKCKECGNRVSTTAKACPKCGNVDLNSPRVAPSVAVWKPWQKYLAISATFLLVLFSYWAVPPGSNSHTPPEQADQKAPAQASPPQNDVENIYALGEAMKRTGYVTDYKVSVGSHSLDLHIGSMLPAEARLIGDGTCDVATKKNFKFKRPWTVQVFLVVGERPAAVCTLH